VRGDAQWVLAPVSVLRPLRGPRVARVAQRLAAHALVRLRAARAARRLRRRGYPDAAVWRWDVEQPLQIAGTAGRDRTLAERLPRAAIIRAGPATQTVLAEVAEAAAGIGGVRVDTSRPLVTAGGVLIAFSPTALVRVAIGAGGMQLERHRAALDALAATTLPPDLERRVPRVLGHGSTGLGTWLLEERLPGRTPDSIRGSLVDDCLDFLVALHGCGSADGGGDSVVDTAAVVARLAGLRPEPLVEVAVRVDERLAGVRRGFGHGDFWRRNVLIDGGRLSGVVDWERSGDHRLPLLDVLQLVVTQQPFHHRPFADVVARALLPRARAGGDDAVRRYCERAGVATEPAVLEALVLAFWLDRLARELEKCGRVDGAARWSARNVTPVLAELRPGAVG
jgi:hypothetical protein